MFNGTPARKRKREIKKILGLAAVIVIIVGLVGGGGYYLLNTTFKKPLYVSPLSTKVVNVPEEETPLDALKKELKQKKVDFTDVKIASDSSLLVSLKDGGVVTFSSEKDILTQVSSLQFILSRLTMEGKLFSQLDLRFDKPVIVLKK